MKLFWDIPLTPYLSPQMGVVKKTTKINSDTIEKRDEVLNKLSQVNEFIRQKIILKTDKTNKRAKFKDSRKISIGISAKDLIHPNKNKLAFFNCIGMNVRLQLENRIFQEYHVKLFNTGKVEIPGIKENTVFIQLMDFLIQYLQPFFDHPLQYDENNIQNVLVNSNFNCGFFINQEKLDSILRNKYNLQSLYDPCRYPGVQGTFYYYNGREIQTGIQSKHDSKKYKKEPKMTTNTIKISFMIFRTGSVLIVGKIKNDEIKEDIYNYLVKILRDEYSSICCPTPFHLEKKKNKSGYKAKKFQITVS